MKIEIESAEAALLVHVHESVPAEGLTPAHVPFLKQLAGKLRTAAKDANGKPAELELTESEFLLLVTKWGKPWVGTISHSEAQLAVVEAVQGKLRAAHEAAQAEQAEPDESEE